MMFASYVCRRAVAAPSQVRASLKIHKTNCGPRPSALRRCLGTGSPEGRLAALDRASKVPTWMPATVRSLSGSPHDAAREIIAHGLRHGLGIGDWGLGTADGGLGRQR